MSESKFQYNVDGRDLLLEDGPLIEVELTAPLPLVQYLRDNHLPAYPVVRGVALLDTGATISAVDESKMIELAIPSLESEIYSSPHGFAKMRQFNLSVSFPSLGLTDVELTLVPGGHFRASSASGSQIIMLVGRDILRRLKFTYDGPGGVVMVEV